MHLHTRNVNTAFRELVEWTDRLSKNPSSGYNDGRVVVNDSRNGKVFRWDEPVTITYSHPRERVLFNAARDANPFFHLYESLWMLAGRNDVAPLAYYNSKITAIASDDGKTFNGAYGHRWRHAAVGLPFDMDTRSVNISTPVSRVARTVTANGLVDQLDILVNHLKADPTSRRAVLQMWNVEDDLLKIGHKATYCDGPHQEKDCPYCVTSNGGKVEAGSKDVCCNLSVMFSIREGKGSQPTTPSGLSVTDNGTHQLLDMTITNRSNDMVWGMLGANYVHFTFLQEYMAARLSCEVGKYHHFSNNLHVYEWNWKPEEWLAEKLSRGGKVSDWYSGDADLYASLGDIPPTEYPGVPLVKDAAVFESELPRFVEANCGKSRNWVVHYQEPFLDTVAQPMMDAFYNYKDKDMPGALLAAEAIKADDWRVACIQWLQRRNK